MAIGQDGIRGAGWGGGTENQPIDYQSHAKNNHYPVVTIIYIICVFKLGVCQSFLLTFLAMSKNGILSGLFFGTSCGNITLQILGCHHLTFTPSAAFTCP